MLRVAGRKFIGFETALLAQADAFGSAVSLDFFEVEDLYARMVEKKGALDGQYDLMMVPGDFYPTMIAEGLLLPINDLINQSPPENWPDAWPPSLLAYQQTRAG